MRKKIQEDRITRKNRRIHPLAQAAAKKGFPTEFAHLVDSTRAGPLKEALKIGVDLMGNDNAPQVLLDALKAHFPKNGVSIVAIGAPEFEKKASPFEYIATDEVIEMDEHPLHALRKKKKASMSISLRLLKEERIDALVSAGNTGALVSGSKMILSMMPKILRPALLTLMPTKKNPVAVLDVGAGIAAKSSHLVQFASIGAAFQKTRGIKKPKVGLLNIGSEALKGTSEIRLAYNQLTKASAFDFVGNIEGTRVFDGDVDVIVTDGFTGNVFLKTAEGIASLILDKIPGAKDIEKFQSLHYAEYPGALLAGVKGIVIKCHGYSTPKGFTNAVLGAIELAKVGFVKKLSNEL